MVKNLPASAGDLGLISGLGGSSEEGKGKLLQCSCLETPTDSGAWRVQSTGSQRGRHGGASKQQWQRPPALTSQSDPLVCQELRALCLAVFCEASFPPFKSQRESQGG